MLLQPYTAPQKGGSLELRVEHEFQIEVRSRGVLAEGSLLFDGAERAGPLIGHPHLSTLLVRTMLHKTL